MSRIIELCIGIIAILIVTTRSFAAEPTGKSELIEGSWTHRGDRTVVMSGSDTSITLKKSGDAWTITFDTISYPGVNKPDAKPVEKREGPFAVQVEDQDLVFTRDKEKPSERFTFLCDKDQLILPAIVQKKPGVWEYKSRWQTFRVACENDPFKIPTGKAEISRIESGIGIYELEQTPKGSQLKLLERLKDGSLAECFRLIFDQYGWPRTPKDFENVVYLAKPDER